MKQRTQHPSALPMLDRVLTGNAFEPHRRRRSPQRTLLRLLLAIVRPRATTRPRWDGLL